MQSGMQLEFCPPDGCPPAPPPGVEPKPEGGGFPMFPILNGGLCVICIVGCVYFRVYKRQQRQNAERRMMQAQAAHVPGTQLSNTPQVQAQLSSLPQAQAQVAPVQMAVTCPPDARPGDSMAVTMGGRQLMVQVPEGVPPGGVFMVQPPVMAVVTGVLPMSTAVPMR